MSTKTLITTLLCITSFASFAATQVYKKVMPDGTIVYTDEPIEEAEVMMVEPVPTVPAFKAPKNDTSSAPQTEPQLQEYTELNIISPSNGSAFHSGSGTVEINFSSTPALRNGHIYKVFLGSRLLAEQTGTQLTVNNIDRGTHSLSVHIVNRAGKVIKTSSSSFTIHRPSKKR